MAQPLFTGTYTRNGYETYSEYKIKKAKTCLINSSTINQVWDFKLDNPPSDDWVYYFGFYTQRIKSYDTTPKNKTLLDEEIFLTITQDDVVIGSLNAKTTYPDAGSGSISSEGFAIYPTFTANGELAIVTAVRIDFFNDGSRNVSFLSA